MVLRWEVRVISEATGKVVIMKYFVEWSSVRKFLGSDIWGEGAYFKVTDKTRGVTVSAPHFSKIGWQAFQITERENVNV